MDVISTRYAIEELLLEKTGKEYQMKERIYYITVDDLVCYISKQKCIDKEHLTEFFNNVRINEEKLTERLEIDDYDVKLLLQLLNNRYKLLENEKKEFIKMIYQSDDLFDNFIKEMYNNKNATELFVKYYELAYDYTCMNIIEG